MKFVWRYFIVGILIAGLVGLRLISLGNIPIALYWDELAIGIDSYAIAETGHDIHGNVWFQAIFPSYGDFKAPVAIWLTALAVKALGLTEFAVRLPFLLMSFLGIISIIGLIKLLIDSKEKYHIPSLLLLGGLFLLTSPWHFHFSRIGFESGMSLTFVSLSLFFLLLGFKKHQLFILLSSLLAAASVYTYFSARIIMPLFAVVMLLVYWKEVWKYKWSVSLAVVLYLLLLQPLYHSPFYKQSEQLRWSATNIINDDSLKEESANLIYQSNGIPLAKLLYHRYFFLARSFLQNYAAHFSPGFLIVNGDGNLRHHGGWGGQVLVVSLLLVAFGLYRIFRRVAEKSSQLVLLWLVVAPITAAIPYEVPHASRSIYLLIPLSVLFVFGCIQVLRSISRLKIAASSVVSVVIILLLGNFALYLEDYYRHYPIRSSHAWQAENKYIGQLVANWKQDYREIIITQRYRLPTLSVLFYNPEFITKIQPPYSKANDSQQYDWIHHFSHFKFMEPERVENQDTLYITGPRSELKEYIKEIFVLPNGDEAVYVAN